MMRGDNLYYMTSLPPLGDLGQPPPIAPRELLDHVDDAPSLRALVEAVLLSDDLLQRDAAEAGGLAEPQPGALRIEQIRGEEPLPAELQLPQGASGPRVPADAVWAAYFRQTYDLARRRGSEFLADWVVFEVGLRNALVIARAKALGLEAGEYLVAPELSEGGEQYAATVSEWAQAPNPLAGQRVLDRSRWNWLMTHDQHFTFSDDELAAYAAKLLLLQRWQRITDAQDADAPGSRPGEDMA